MPGTQKSSAAEDGDQVEVDRFQTVGVDGGDDRVVQELVWVLLHLDGESHFLCQLVRFDLPITFLCCPFGVPPTLANVFRIWAIAQFIEWKYWRKLSKIGRTARGILEVSQDFCLQGRKMSGIHPSLLVPGRCELRGRARPGKKVSR